jgi:hypothetical protein
MFIEVFHFHYLEQQQLAQPDEEQSGDHSLFGSSIVLLQQLSMLGSNEKSKSIVPGYLCKLIG